MMKHQPVTRGKEGEIISSKAQRVEDNESMNHFPDEKFDSRDSTEFPNLIPTIPRVRAVVVRINGIIN